MVNTKRTSKFIIAPLIPKSVDFLGSGSVTPELWYGFPYNLAELYLGFPWCTAAHAYGSGEEGGAGEAPPDRQGFRFGFLLHPN